MGEKIKTLGIKRDNDLMYYIKGGDVWATPRKKPGQPKGKATKVAAAGIEMDYGRYLYYLDGDGDEDIIASTLEGSLLVVQGDGAGGFSLWQVVPFGLAATQRAMAAAFAQSGVSGQMGLRKGQDGHVFVTDGGHWIIDAHLGRITDAPRLAGLLSPIPGVVEHGLFIGLASIAILAGAQGIRVVERR